ncbi:hypothetical protein [Sorangium sp. So ce1335]|uniref:hypothetical protein n=1 Tax=Sorangium sp. So ce1335 TaxID=3133335 RepID=UPI003F5D7A3F
MMAVTRPPVTRASGMAIGLLDPNRARPRCPSRGLLGEPSASLSVNSRGGQGGPGGYGGPGRGGDSIGIAYLDEDQLRLERVSFEIGPPGSGGMSWDHDGSTTMGPSGESHETLRFPE